MGATNRCPNCGGMKQHFVTTTKGERLSVCYGVLCTLIPSEKGNDHSRFRFCDSVFNEDGTPFNSVAVYRVDATQSKPEGRLEAITIRNGRLK